MHIVLITSDLIRFVHYTFIINMGNGNQEFDSALESHDTFLLNEYVKYVSWESISVTVNDKVTKKVKPILSDVSGRVNAGPSIHDQDHNNPSLSMTYQGKCLH